MIRPVPKGWKPEAVALGARLEPPWDCTWICPLNQLKARPTPPFGGESCAEFGPIAPKLRRRLTGHITVTDYMYKKAFKNVAA